MKESLPKSLIVDPDLCTGCRICELRCSLYHHRESNPSRALLHVVRLESQGLFIPAVCKHCTEAFCMYACPTGAIYRDGSTNAVLVESSKCVGCRSCMVACPWGLIWMNCEGKIDKCDLCGGTPKCAQWCPTEAIKYERLDKQHLKKMSRMAIRDAHSVREKEAVLQKIYYSGLGRILSNEKKE